MVTPVDVGGSIAKGQQINQMKAQMEAYKQAQQEQAQLKSLYSERYGGTDPKTGITWNTGRQAPGGGPAMTNEQFTGRAMAINPQAGMDWQKHFASQDAATLERDKAEAPLVVGAFESVRDQAGYDQARQMLAQRGVDVSDIPPAYDPSLTNMVVQGSRYLAGNWPTAAGRTSTQKEYEQAVAQGFKGSLLDYKTALAQAGKAETNVTVGGGKYGTIPAGYQLVEGPQGAQLVPIPGGPAAAEIAETAAQEEMRQGQKATAANVVIEDIDRVIGMTETAKWYDPVAGVVGGIASNVPGSDSFNAGKLLSTVKANAGFDKLQSMREASPTGGALGAVSDFENRLLQSTIGNLEQSQDKEQFLYNLKRVRSIYSAIINKGIKPGDPLADGAGGGVGDFSTMAPQDLLSVDVDSLSGDQLKQLDAAMTAAGL